MTVRPSLARRLGAESATLDAGANAAAADGSRIRDGVLYCVKVFLTLRGALFLLALVAVSALPALDPVSVPGWPGRTGDTGLDVMFTSWERQDALWFLRIAEDGYRVGDGSAAFFPLYPLAVRALSATFGGRPLLASLVVSNLACLGALIVLYFLSASELSPRAARRVVAYVAVFPTSFFLLAPYSESLFLLLSVTAFWAARRGKWPLAGLVGAFASATRSVGILLGPALAVEAIHQWRERRGSGRAVSATAAGSEDAAEDGSRVDRPTPSLVGMLAWVSVSLGGALAYLLFWQAKAGDLLAPVSRQQNWLREAVMPWTALVDGTQDAFCCLAQFSGGYHLIDWLVVVPSLGLAGYALFRFRPTFGIYAWGSILLPLSLVFRPRPLMSMPRFLVVVFPIMWALADLVERRRIPNQAVVGVSAGMMAVLAVLFINWYYVF